MRQQFGSFLTVPRRVVTLAGGIAILAVMLGACADGEGDRRFANDPLPTEDLLAQPSAPVSTRIVQPTQSPMAPMTSEGLLTNPGTAPRVFVQVGDSIMMVPVDGSPTSSIVDGKGGSLVAFAASGDGERIAVILVSQTTGALTLRIVERTGQVSGDVPINVSGSPIPSGTGRYRIAWSPDGRKFLLSLAAGGILEISEKGVVRSLLDATSAPAPRDIAWSPDGTAIAWVDAGIEGGATGLYVASTDALPIDPVTVIRPIPGKSRQIVDIEWGAGSTGILYTERAPGGDLSIGGDLFAISPSGGSPRLIATAGGVAQVGAIGSFALSPDGDTVAYSVLVPDQSGVVVRGLILRQIDGPASVDVLTGPGATLEGLIWTTNGLSWQIRPADNPAEHVQVELAIVDGSTATLFVAPPQATPVASPVAPATPGVVPTPGVTPTST